MVGVIVGVFGGVFAGAMTAEVRADTAEVEALIAKANELRQQGNPWQALPYYQKAYELEHTPRTAGQLGVGELAAGYPVEAADHLAVALRSPQHPWVARYKSILEETLTKARGRIGEIVIEGNVRGATVAVNGHDLGKLSLPTKVNVAAGSVEVAVHADGYVDLKRTVEVAGGGHERLAIDLVKSADAPVASIPAKEIGSTSGSPAAIEPSDATVIAEHPSDQEPSIRLAGFITGGVAVAALATGGALQLLAIHNIHEFNATCWLADFGPISKSTLMASSQCSTAYDNSSSEKKWSTISYVAGGALAISAGILFWWSYRGVREENPRRRAHVRCVPGPTGVACGGVF
jgi:hypothetical protein